MTATVRQSQVRTHGWAYLHVYGLPPLVIVRLPLPMPRWRDVLKALTPVARFYGARKKDISGLDACARDDLTTDPYSRLVKDNEERLASLAWAYAGDPSQFVKFELWAWDHGHFVLVRAAS